jgi:hypothetical protein
MEILLLGLFGLIFGGFVGGLIGVAAGFLWINVFQTSCFEGYCGMLVFFTFMPVGMFAGGLVGASVLGSFGAEASEEPPHDGN